MVLGTEIVGILKKRNFIASATVLLMSISGGEKNRHEVVEGARNDKQVFHLPAWGGVL